MTTSYNFNSPLTEWGNYTGKYHMIRRVYEEAVAKGIFPRTRLPDVPPYVHPKNYLALSFTKVLPFAEMLKLVPRYSTSSGRAPNMEALGQNFGFILYRVEGKLPLQNYSIDDPINDRSVLYIDGAEVAVNNEPLEEPFVYNISSSNLDHSKEEHSFDLLVENQGRVNFGIFMQTQRKGLHNSEIKLDGRPVANITTYSLELNSSFVDSLQQLKVAPEGPWIQVKNFKHQNAPAMYSALLYLSLHEEPGDTFVELPGWTKGNVFVNGFNLGRYWEIGPLKTLYLPGPLLRRGNNRVDVFELHRAGKEVHFIDHPKLF